MMKRIKKTIIAVTVKDTTTMKIQMMKIGWIASYVKVGFTTVVQGIMFTAHKTAFAWNAKKNKNKE